MTLKDRGVCNVANVCWQRVPDRQTSHRKRRSPNLVTVGGTVYDDVSMKELVKRPNEMEKSCLNLIIASWQMEEKKEEEETGRRGIGECQKGSSGEKVPQRIDIIAATRTRRTRMMRITLTWA